jgi:hypothetical protein
MPAELWSPRRIAQELGLSGPNSARKWLSTRYAAGTPIPVAKVVVDKGRHTYLYDSALVLAARKEQQCPAQ